MVNTMDYLLAMLAVWRLTHLIYTEAGPWNIMVFFRSFVARSIFSNLITCFYCLSLWVAVPFAYYLSHSWISGFVGCLALSAVAIFIHEILQTQTVEYYEEREEK